MATTTDLASLKTDLARRMDGAMETLRRDFGGLRTGRASPALLEPVRVEAYGTEVPITQVGTIAVPEPRMLTVQVWDRSMVSAVEKAIRMPRNSRLSPSRPWRPKTWSNARPLTTGGSTSGNSTRARTTPGTRVSSRAKYGNA